MSKKVSVILVVIMFLSISNSALGSQKTYLIEQNEEENNIFLSYTFGSPELSSIIIDNKEFSKINLDDLPLSQKVGAPKLPVKPLKILLPPSTKINKINIKTYDSKILQNFKKNELELSGISHSFNYSKMKKSNNSMYDKEKIYPIKTYKNLGIQRLNGYLILYINLHPVRYLDKTKTVYYYSEMSVSIETKSVSFKENFQTFNDRERIEKMVENPDMLDNYPAPQTRNNNGEQNFDYIIITTEDLKNASGEYTLNDLINQREKQGLSCTFKTVEEIIQQYPGVDIQEKIRNFIKDAYLNWNLKWVLLAGDVEKVPIRYLYDIDGVETDEKEITSDVYYQCLDGNYNYDGDEKWGEEFDGVNGDRIDLLAEVYVGRAPVDDSQDVSNFVEKTLVYENSDWFEDTYLKSVLSAGETLWSGPGGYGSGYVERCIDFCSDYDQNTYGIPTDLFSFTKLYEKNGGFSTDDVKNVINNGVSIINHVGHGTSIKAMKLGINDLMDLTNLNKYSLFYTQACHSGQLERQDQCFAERWVNLPKKGGFAAIMNTGYGYGSVNNYDGADNRYAREFFDALFSPIEEISRIGKANQDSKEDNIWHIDEKNMYHVYYDTILFGDPYLSIKGAEEANAQFSYEPLYAKTNQNIHFNDMSLGMITYRLWNFGDGHTTSIKNPNHAYGSEGIYQVKLEVQDNQGYHSTITKSVQIKEQWDPIANIYPKSYNGFNFKIDFSAIESWDPDGDIVSYHWDFDDGSTSVIAEPVHIYKEEGTYHVTLQVEDNEGNYDRDFATIVLSKQYPPDKPVLIDGATNTYTGLNSAFTTISTDPEQNDIQYGWDFGDGNGIIWSDWYNSGEKCTYFYIWDKTGIFDVKVKARDENYGESNWSEIIKVNVSDEKEPYLEIIKPKKGIYISNEKKLSFLSTIVFGDIDIIVNATDASGIKKVLFYIDNQNQPAGEALSSPYIFTWNEKKFFKHEIKIVAIDKAGKQSTLQINIWKFF